MSLDDAHKTRLWFLSGAPFEPYRCMEGLQAWIASHVYVPQASGDDKQRVKKKPNHFTWLFALFQLCLLRLKAQ